jgi:hypothetical protein
VVLGSVACGSAQAATQNTTPTSSVTIQDLQKQVADLQERLLALENYTGLNDGKHYNSDSLRSRIQTLQKSLH